MIATISVPFISDYIAHHNQIREVEKFMNNEIKNAEAEISDGFPNEAIQSCDMVIKEYNNLSANDKGELIFEYSMAKYITGIAYNNISRCRDRHDNLEKAILALKESAFSGLPSYKNIFINLSTAYLDMSKIEQKEDNLKESVKYIDKYLEITRNDEEYARAQVIRGTAYRYLSEVRDKQENLKKSIGDYESALISLENLNSSHPGKYILDIGVIRSNLGSSYRFLSEIEDSKNNLDKSRNNNSISLEFLAEHSDELAYAKHNRGALYLTYYNYYLLCNPIADVESEWLRDYLSEAIKFFNESLNLQDQCSLERVDTTINLEYANVILSASSSNYKNKISDSIHKYTQLLSKYNKSEYPFEYAKINSYLGTAFFYRAKISKSEVDLIESIYHFNEALSVWTKEEYPLCFAEANRNLGLAYGLKKFSLEKARMAFSEAADIWRSDPCPNDYAYAEYLLGKTYLSIYKIDKDYELAIEARNAFQNSSSFFNEDDYPEMSRSIKKYINNTIDPCYF